MYNEVVTALKDAGYKVVDERVDDPIPGTIKLVLTDFSFVPQTFDRVTLTWEFAMYMKQHTPTVLRDEVEKIANVLNKKFPTMMSFSASFDPDTITATMLVRFQTEEPRDYAST